MVRASFAVLLTLGLVTVPSAPARAQVPVPVVTGALLDPAVPGAPTFAPALVPALKTPTASGVAQRSAPLFTPPAAPRRPLVLVPMYAGVVALQGYDAYSTLTALRHGAVEMNPLMAGAARRPAALVAVKAAATVGTIWAAERLWRNHRKGAAIALVAVTNGMLAVVAARNASVLRGQR